jgi:hypothetical protein
MSAISAIARTPAREHVIAKDMWCGRSSGDRAAQGFAGSHVGKHMPSKASPLPDVKDSSAWRSAAE